MKNKCNSIIFYVTAFFCMGIISGVNGTELVGSATQLGKQKVHAEIYYRHMARQDLSLAFGGSGSVNVNGSTLTSTSLTEADIEGSGEGMMGKVSVQPFDNGLRYYIVGGFGTYDLKVPSGSLSNTFSTDNPGMVIGGGIKYTLVPYTIVSPALSVDLSAVHSRYALTKFRSGDGKLTGDTGYLLTIFEIQAALTLSKKFIFKLGDGRATFDPYLGMKIIRNRVNADNLSTGSHQSGTKVGWAPFFGFKFKPFPLEGLVLEGSLFNETSASVGLTLGF